jgi:pimeloyl-ACP methyl ester carboxylesterase
LPSVDLPEQATAVQVVHAATGSNLNSTAIPCLDFTSVDADSDPTDFLTWSLCPIDGPAPPPPTAVCGFFAVPENRDDPGTRHINIAFAIVWGDGQFDDPIVYLEGGPGGAPLSVSGIIMELAMGPASGGRDVIFVDQRGTGYAQPNLNCIQQQDHPLEQPSFESAEQATAVFDEFFRNCRDRLGQEAIDLDGYTSVQNSADIADLRIALGYEQWNLFGGSYGSDLALTIMREHPEGVRSVVLDSVFPPEVNPPAGEQAIGYLKQLDGIATRCNVDPVCSRAIPDLRSDLNKAVEHLLVEAPIVSGTEIEVLFGEPERALVAPLFLDILNFDFGNPYIAALVHGLSDDDTTARTAAAQRFFRATALWVLGLPPEVAEDLQAKYYGVPGEATEFSDGFNLTVLCAEEHPFTDTATAYDGPGWSAAINEFAFSFFDDFARACGYWDIAPEDPIVTKPVVSDLPTLVVYTDLDYQTVPEWSELAASRLTNADLVLFPNLGHVVTFFGPCPQNVVHQFFDNPGGPLDTSCIDELPPIFYLGVLPDIPPLPPIDEFFDKLDEFSRPPEAGGGTPQVA